MDEASLEKSLLKMEREVLALKTSHNIGLGTIRFYEKSILTTGTTTLLRGTITIAAGEPLPPFLFVILPIGVVLSPFVNVETGTATFYYGSSEPIEQGNIVCISSSLIESITLQ